MEHRNAATRDLLVLRVANHIYGKTTLPIFLGSLERLRWLSAVAKDAAESANPADHERLLTIVFPEAVAEATRAIRLNWQLLAIPGLLAMLAVTMLACNLYDYHIGRTSFWVAYLTLAVWLVNLRTNADSVGFAIKSLWKGYVIRGEIRRSWAAYNHLQLVRYMTSITTITH